MWNVCYPYFDNFKCLETENRGIVTPYNYTFPLQSVIARRPTRTFLNNFLLFFDTSLVHFCFRFHFWNYPPQKILLFSKRPSEKNFSKLSPTTPNLEPTKFPLIVKQKILEKHPKKQGNFSKINDPEISSQGPASLSEFQVNLSRRIGAKFNCYTPEVTSDR